MTHTQLVGLEPHVFDDSREVIESVDEQIKDLYKALDQAEAAIDKLRGVSR